MAGGTENTNTTQENESSNKRLKKVKNWFSKLKTSSRKKKQQESSGLEV